RRRADGGAEQLVRLRRAQRLPRLHRRLTPPPSHREETSVTVVESPAARGQEAPPSTAGQQAAQPEALPRDPEARLDALFDPGTMAVLTPHDDSGAMAATGKIDGVLAVAVASDPPVSGRPSGRRWCA